MASLLAYSLEAPYGYPSKEALADLDIVVRFRFVTPRSHAITWVRSNCAAACLGTAVSTA